MDTLRSNLTGYYTHQQYTPVPIPVYPPTFSNPTPYAQNHIHPDQSYSHHHNGYDHTQTIQAQPVTYPLIAAPAPDPVPQNTQGITLDESANQYDGAAQNRPNSNAPRGFGRTSAVYRIDGHGVKRRVVAEDFRAEVEERTRNGESCEQIADALIAQGAQVTSKSISRWRIMWGFRKRAVRKQTKPPKPAEERVNKKRIFQSKYRADITRMSQAGLKVEEIARIMTARGMVLKKGPSTIARLQTVWKLRGDEETRIKNKRYLCRRKAREAQLEEFKNYARDLAPRNPERWIRRKMEEPAVRQLRHAAACELMGDDAPTLKELRRTGPGRPWTIRSSAQYVNSAQEREDQTEDEEDADDDDPNMEGQPATQALPSDLVPDVTQQGENSGSDSNYGDPGYQSMGDMHQMGDHGLSLGHLHHIDYQHMEYDENYGYQTMMEDEDDDLDDDDEGDLDADHDPVAPQYDPQILQPPAPFTDATLAVVPPPAGEQRSMNGLVSVADGCIAAAQLFKDLVQAKAEGKPGPRSLTGLPPSVADVEMARHRFKEAAQATVNLLQSSG